MLSSVRSSLRLFSTPMFLAAHLAVLGLTVAGSQAQTTYNSSGGATASGANGSGSNTITVTGATGSVKAVSVTLKGVTSDGQSGYDSVGFTSFVLTSPGGEKFVLLGATGDGTDGSDNCSVSCGINNVTITIADSAPGLAPGATNAGGGETNPWPPNTPSFTVKPSSYWLSPYSDPAATTLPPDISGDSVPQSDGSSTLNGAFTNATGNGGWTLSILTDDSFGTDQVSISSWSLTLTYNATVAASTSTSVSSSVASPAATSSSVTYTATVSSTSTVSAGAVTFSANGSNLACSQGDPVPVSNGQAICTTVISIQGLYDIGANYGGTASFSSSSGSKNELYETATTQSGSTFCNTGSLTIAQSGGISGIYPSVIKVTGYPGQTVSNVEVQLKDVTGNIQAQHLLVAPDGARNLDFLDAGFSSTASVNSGVNLNFYDSAGIYPNPGNNPSSPDDYEASDTNAFSNTDTFPASSAPGLDSSIPQVPGTINYGYNPYEQSHGPVTETFESNFRGATADGDWVLYPYEEDAYGETIGGGWCVALTLNTGTSTSTAVTSSANPLTTGTSASLTATVKAGGAPVTSGGTATFLDNGTDPTCTTGCSSGSNVVNLNGSGQAAFPFNGLYYTISTGVSGGNETYQNVFEGDHAFTVDFSGTSSDNPSTGSLVQRMDNATTFSSGSGGSINACNAGPILSGQGSIGAFTPNPSNIFVSGMPGTVNAINLTLSNFYTYAAGSNEIETVVKGPTGAALDFFSSTGNGNTILSEGNYTFADSASNLVPQSQFGPGTYKPTAYQNNNSSTDSFTSSTSGFYNKPGSFNYAAPHGSSSFGSSFSGSIPNGTWSLFFDQVVAEDSAGAANGWCLNFTENPVTVGATEAHTGTGAGGDLVQGEQSAQLSTSITNNGTGATGDPVGTNPLTVTDTLNAALTYISFSGSGWICTASGQTVTCKNDSSVAQSSSYPTLTINVNVSASAGSSISNLASISGAGVSSTTTNTDMITVLPSPVLSIGKTHPGIFMQGQTAEWDISVSNTAAGSTTSGTVNVSDILPSGYTVNNFSTTAGTWNCGGTTTVSCTTTLAEGGGSTFPRIEVIVNVPTTSPTTVSNTASAWGGGDLTHTSSATAAAGSDNNVPVVQIPASTTTTGVLTTPYTPGNAGTAVITVTGVSGGPYPTGNLTYAATNAVGTSIFSGTAMLSSGSATITIPASIAYKTVALSYQGDGNYSPSTGSFSIPGGSVTIIASDTATTATVDVFGFGPAAPSGILNLTDATSGTAVTGPVTLNTGNAVRSFLPQTTSSTGAGTTYPVWTTLADVNGDGILDLITSLYDTDSITVQLGKGNGTFGAATIIHFTTGFGPAENHAVVLRTGSSKVDIIAGSFNFNQVAVILGNGNGTFAAPAYYTVGSSKNTPTSLTTGNFYGTGNIDIATSDYADNTASMLIGAGDGTFTVESNLIHVGKEPEAVRFLSPTGGLPGILAVANFGSNTVTLIPFQGGVQQTAATLNVGRGPQALAFYGSTSNSAQAQLAVANYTDNSVTIGTVNNTLGNPVATSATLTRISHRE
jgi:uncharacterized repeat protein (TIGR01451 family)